MKFYWGHEWVGIIRNTKKPRLRVNTKGNFLLPYLNYYKCYGVLIGDPFIGMVNKTKYVRLPK